MYGRQPGQTEAATCRASDRAGYAEHKLGVRVVVRVRFRVRIMVSVRVRVRIRAGYAEHNLCEYHNSA